MCGVTPCGVDPVNLVGRRDEHRRPVGPTKADVRCLLRQLDFTQKRPLCGQTMNTVLRRGPDKPFVIDAKPVWNTGRDDGEHLAVVQRRAVYIKDADMMWQIIVDAGKACPADRAAIGYVELAFIG